MKQTWPAPERNKRPILDVLQRVLPQPCRVLEIASGSGQHAAFFATEQPGWTWQPSDVDPENLASIEAWVRAIDRANLLRPLRIDVCALDWDAGPPQTWDALYCANMIHIAPWACCEGLIRGGGTYLRSGGVLALYGPFRFDGAHTSESNARFDEGLKARDPSWGVRDAGEVAALAAQHNLRLAERVAMPANNQTLIFVRD